MKKYQALIVCVINPSLRLRLTTQTLGLIILHIHCQAQPHPIIVNYFHTVDIALSKMTVIALITQP
jgi:hypothetical protein